MMRLCRGLVVLLCGLLFVCPVRAGDLAASIEAVLQRPEYHEGRWGILITDDAGYTVYAHHPEQLCTPASTTKLYSCAAALVALGPDHRFETPVHRRGDVVDGRLKGDLILVASGDLTLGGRTTADGKMAFTNSDHIYASGGTATELTPTDPLAGLKDLAKQVAAAGIHQVEGDVLIDDRLFVKSHGSGSGPNLVASILVNDNVVDLVVTPADKAGEAATVRMRPETSYVQLDAQVATVAEGKSPHLELIAAGPQRVALRGQVPLNDKPRTLIYPMDDPAGFARALFSECLRQAGVAVHASPLQAPQAELPERASYAKLPRVATYTSPPLAEALKVTLKVSHNLYASTLPLLVAVKHNQQTLVQGLRQQRRILADLGVDVATISFAGGAGGANADAVTPRATVQLLQALAKRPDWPAFRSWLPVLGVDGTLSDVIPADSAARGKVLAKTGTLYWNDLLNDRLLLRSKALAGTALQENALKTASSLADRSVFLQARPARKLHRPCGIPEHLSAIL